MKKSRGCLWGILGLVFFCGAFALVYFLNARFLDSSQLNQCTLDEDCVIVPPAFCGYPPAINRNNLSLWELHTKLLRMIPIPAACAPSPPMSAFQPECLYNACRPVLINDHAILEFLSLPQLGQPADLEFRIKTSGGVNEPRARIEIIPNIATINSGDQTWNDPLAPEEEKRLNLSVTFVKPGYYQIHGFTRGSNESTMTDDVFFLLTQDGIQYGEKAINQWDTSHFAYLLGTPDDRLWRELVFDSVPALDQETTIHYRIRSDVAMQYADMQIVLPPGGFEVIDMSYPSGGDHGEYISKFTLPGQPVMQTQLWWHGSIQADVIIEIQVKVKIISPGWGLVWGSLRSEVFKDNVIYNWVYVDEYNGYVEIRETP